MTRQALGYKITDKFPVPGFTTRKKSASSENLGRPAIYPFAELKRGESFFVPGSPVNRLSAAATHHSRSGKRFICRTDVYRGSTGVRVWRVQ